MENEFLDTSLMQRIKNLSQQNEEMKNQISEFKAQRIEAEESLKAEISIKVNL